MASADLRPVGWKGRVNVGEGKGGGGASERGCEGSPASLSPLPHSVSLLPPALPILPPPRTSEATRAITHTHKHTCACPHVTAHAHATRAMDAPALRCAVADFLASFTHEVLYQRGLYASDIFERR